MANGDEIAPRNMLPQTVKIVQIIEETRAIKTFVLDAAVPDAEPGQFVMLWLPNEDEKPISIAAPDPLTLTVARVGPFSIALHGCQVGDYLGWRGPFGRPYQLHADRPAVLVGGGYGSAPLHYLAIRMLSEGTAAEQIIVALGARRQDHLIYVDRFRALGLEPLIATDDGSVGYMGYVTDAVMNHLESRQLKKPPVIYGCGPEGMLVALYRIARERGFDAQLSVERYMKCGFGLCGQCAIDGLLVCLDGPVLTLDQLDGVQDFGRFHRSTTGRRMPV
jgi:dihydroorotate dehydrogenase electron transfer subunit